MPVSNCIPHSSYPTPHSIFPIPHSSYPILFLILVPNSIFLIPHTPFLILYSPFLIPHILFFILLCLHSVPEDVDQVPLPVRNKSDQTTNKRGTSKETSEKGLSEERTPLCKGHLILPHTNTSVYQKLPPNKGHLNTGHCRCPQVVPYSQVPLCTS